MTTPPSGLVERIREVVLELEGAEVGAAEVVEMVAEVV